MHQHLHFKGLSYALPGSCSLYAPIQPTEWKHFISLSEKLKSFWLIEAPTQGQSKKKTYHQIWSDEMKMLFEYNGRHVMFFKNDLFISLISVRMSFSFHCWIIVREEGCLYVLFKLCWVWSGTTALLFRVQVVSS